MQKDEQQRVFDGWLRKHQGLFFKIVRAYAVTPQDQEDLFQEIATQVWRSIPGFRGDAAVTTWIYRVALNAAITWTQKERDTARGNKDWMEWSLQFSRPRRPRIRGSSGSTSRSGN